MTPTELFKKTLQCVLDRDMAGYASLWAEDGTFIFPFAVPGATRKLVGPAEIGEYMKDYATIVDVHSFPDVKIHLTHDPEVIVVAFSAEGSLWPAGSRTACRTSVSSGFATARSSNTVTIGTMLSTPAHSKASTPETFTSRPGRVDR